MSELSKDELIRDYEGHIRTLTEVLELSSKLPVSVESVQAFNKIAEQRVAILAQIEKIKGLGPNYKIIR